MGDGEGMVSRVPQTGKPIVIDEAAAEPGYPVHLWSGTTNSPTLVYSSSALRVSSAS